MNSELEILLKNIGRYMEHAHLDEFEVQIDKCHQHIYYNVTEDNVTTDEGSMKI